MAKTIPHILMDVEELLRERKFEKAIAELGGIDLMSISPDEKAFAGLLLVEANLYLGNCKIENTLEDVVLYYRDSADNIKYARAKFLKGWLLTSLGELSEAKEVLLEAYVHFKRCNEYRGQARALNRLSFVAYHTGDIESAKNYLYKCIEIYDDKGNETSKASVVLNLSRLLFASGDLSKSIAKYDELEPAILKLGEKSSCIYYFMSAMPHALKGDFTKARRIIRKATLYYDDYPREKAIYYENLGWIYLLEEDYNSACEVLQKGLTISLNIAPESALVSQTKRQLGDAYLGLGDYGKSRKYTDDALRVAERLKERAEIAACHRIYARLESIRGNNHQAREWFKKAIDMFQMTGLKYDLALTRYLAGNSGLYTNGERQALLYLAREYFESEDVKHYVKKLNAEISRASLIRPRPGSKDGDEPEIVTVNLEMQRLVELAENVSASEMSVLLMGPTGTGKDLFAKFIHRQSGRPGQFVAVNSAAIPDSMIEAELFGHRKGSFTGAAHDKSGLIEVAEGGTLYLNEIAESSPEFQTKLLDVLESKKIRRLGETNERKVDFRLLAATNHNLEKLVRQGKFRADLYHRINEVSLELPALRDRRGDVAALTEYFLIQSGVDPHGNSSAFKQLVKVFSTWDWPGNVRQLQAEVRRLALLSEGNLHQMTAAASEKSPNDRDRILEMLNETGWNRREVARRLNLSEATIRRRIKILNLIPPSK